MLFLTAGIVFLTLCVNGTTTKKLLEILKLTEVSPGRIEEMSNAVKLMRRMQVLSTTMLQHDRLLSDANWEYVQKCTTINNPYSKVVQHMPDFFSFPMLLIKTFQLCQI